MSYTFLQNYWWFLIALLGGLLVFLMFVQGANLHLGNRTLSDLQKRMILNSTGRKWELTFTTLVTFGGAFFASFPLFYSTSFGGAYWVWVLILITFVFQAVSYEFQNKKENLIGSQAFRVFLMINGILAPLLIGTAVGTFFTGSDFTVNRAAITDPAAPVISTWGNGWHGLEALVNYHALLLGCSLMFLSAVLGALYVLTNVDDPKIHEEMRHTVKMTLAPFLLFFLTWLVILLVRPGYAVDEAGVVTLEKYKYLHNFLQMPAVLVMFVIGVLLVLRGFILGAFTKSCHGFWPAGLGTVLVVMAVFFIAGYNGTAYYPSCTDLQSSLSIRNSSSSPFTLQVMFWVSLLIPFVVAYIAYAWRQMDRKKITSGEISGTSHKY
ncbi:MAG: cytochrome d ubiquinol oxidase subunit II [Bacteroidales bacterium]|nr:cytochrome d ubiquinol oxidase subunit II [Bacteroidales bacterium]MBQ2149515.1 cytochrome d ubiquinol oxidase subunit II [Bacteroidales bacterium]MBQ5439133.1 cytochrome d ubiquinol oxidase subunit II [Bacteroidales bacterium]